MKSVESTWKVLKEHGKCRKTSNVTHRMKEPWCWSYTGNPQVWLHPAGWNLSVVRGGTADARFNARRQVSRGPNTAGRSPMVSDIHSHMRSSVLCHVVSHGLRRDLPPAAGAGTPHRGECGGECGPPPPPRG
jgi:hypothetical protein